MWPVGLREAEIICKEAPIITLLKRVTDAADRFDVVHSHLDWFGFPLVDLVAKPVLTTLHGWMDLPELAPLFQAFPHAPLISISDAQRRPLGERCLMGFGSTGGPPMLPPAGTVPE